MKRLIGLMAAAAFALVVGTPAMAADHAAVGADKCAKMCHKVEYTSWAASKHGTAAKKTECEACHGNGADYMKMAVMKDPVKAKEAGRLSAIRLLNAAIKQREVDERVELDDTAVAAVIEKLVKQRKDSVTQYEAANRQDLADIEKAEIEILSAYLPEKMGSEEVAAAVAAAVTQTGAKGPADMGKLMGVLKPRLAGKADMAEVSKLVKAALAG